ncbi:hypothetical protein [Polynucleobacter sp. JS-JIR-II-b4]|uniref:hypothetical protein n=1 Tax=Polynucleobacter sp. JS-JIR-II-b4 TaxID=1758390 RepID=UPI001BFEC0C7|nr:hypothetical protein [Polynucleobacter sp. JS-JIR-II-b4]QWE02790.1 hypothetical protein ICV90_01480 [Polynucleobacter sp. JS-JIR-II-b4]
MILAWVISLLLLCSSLVAYLERLNALRIVEVKTMQVSQRNFISAESAVLECEKNLTALADLNENRCFIQSAGKNHWLISSKEKPAIQIGVVIDEKTGVATRMNWRQVFE